MALDPYCFVLMPFGIKADPNGGPPIDFDRIYHDVLVPAITNAGMQPHRDDLVRTGGVVQKSIFEALLLCEYAIADLTTSNPNVLYELGIRHAARPASTLTITARPETLTFDVHYLRSIRYTLNDANRLARRSAHDLRIKVEQELGVLRRRVTGAEPFADSPLFQLIDGWNPPHPESLKTDIFRDRVEYNEAVKLQLAELRAAVQESTGERVQARSEASRIQQELLSDPHAEAGIMVDLLLTYRALEDWDGMISLVESVPGYLREKKLMQEQLAFALNRRAEEGRSGDRVRALQVLEAVAADDRGSSETYGLIGRVHKGRWRAATGEDERQHHLQEAIKAYRHGFELDPRDPYPGVNALTMLRMKGGAAADAQIADLLPVVKFAARRLIKLRGPSYWSHASLLELAVISGKEHKARRQLSAAIPRVTERWEPRTTAANLRDLAAAPGIPDTDRDWISELTAALEEIAQRTVSVT